MLPGVVTQDHTGDSLPIGGIPVANPDSQPRAVENPQRHVMADLSPRDLEIGVTTDDDGGWGERVLPSPVTRGRFVGLLSTAGLLQLRYTLIKRNWYRRRH